MVARNQRFRSALNSGWACWYQIISSELSYIIPPKMVWEASRAVLVFVLYAHSICLNIVDILILNIYVTGLHRTTQQNRKGLKSRQGVKASSPPLRYRGHDLFVVVDEACQSLQFACLQLSRWRLQSPDPPFASPKVVARRVASGWLWTYPSPCYLEFSSQLGSFFRCCFTNDDTWDSGNSTPQWITLQLFIDRMRFVSTSNNYAIDSFFFQI